MRATIRQYTRLLVIAVLLSSAVAATAAPWDPPYLPRTPLINPACFLQQQLLQQRQQTMLSQQAQAIADEEAARRRSLDLTWQFRQPLSLLDNLNTTNHTLPLQQLRSLPLDFLEDPSAAAKLRDDDWKRLMREILDPADSMAWPPQTAPYSGPPQWMKDVPDSGNGNPDSGAYGVATEGWWQRLLKPAPAIGSAAWMQKLLDESGANDGLGGAGLVGDWESILKAISGTDLPIVQPGLPTVTTPGFPWRKTIPTGLGWWSPVQPGAIWPQASPFGPRRCLPGLGY